MTAQRNEAGQATNDGEALFDEYLQAMGYDFDPIPPLTTPTADRKVHTTAGPVIVEIEGFERSAADIEMEKWFERRGHRDALWGAINLDRIDNLIKHGRKQLDRPEYASMPRLLTIVASPHIDTSDLIVQTVMYGYPGISVSGGPGKQKEWPMKKQGRLRNPGGPISAVAVLDKVCPDLPAFCALLEQERERIDLSAEQFADVAMGLIGQHPELDLNKQVLSLVVHENMFAALQLPRLVFWGPVDRRWGVEEGWYQELIRNNYYFSSSVRTTAPELRQRHIEQ